MIALSNHPSAVVVASGMVRVADGWQAGKPSWHWDPPAVLTFDVRESDLTSLLRMISGVHGQLSQCPAAAAAAAAAADG